MESLVEIALSVLPLRTGQCYLSTLSPHATVVGIELHTLVKCSNGLRGILQLQVSFGLHSGNAGVLAPTCSHRVEVFQRPVVVLLLDATQRTVVPQPLSFGIVAQGGVIVADGSIEVFLLDTAESAQLVDSHNIGIALDGLRTVVLGTVIVVEIVFGHSAIEPRFVEIGFGRDSLIKVLDAQHIVLIIESCATYHHQTVGIELCM